jgi:predicted small secreted protein
MGRVTGQQALFIGILLLMACLVMSCRNADSGAGDTPNQTGVMLAQTGGENLHRVTLRITGMS